MLRKNKRTFTLLEIGLVLLLLSVIGALTTAPIARLIRSHRFQKEISAFYMALQDAQLIAVTRQTELQLEVTSVHGAYRYRLTTDEPLPKSLLCQKFKPLKTVKKMLLNGKQEKDVIFRFLSTGRVEPASILTFLTEEASQERRIDFQQGVCMHENANYKSSF